MDDRRFDDLTRAVATGATRRAVLRGLLGAAGGLLGLGGAARALGQPCRQAGRLCNTDANCCSGLCDTTNADPTQRNRCVCPPGQETCRGACKDPATDYQGDVLNCGGCGVRCPVDQCNQATCTGGVCGLAPNPARVGKACDDGDPCTDGGFCQADGTCQGTPVCPPCQVCDGGACVTAADDTACGTGQKCCGGICTDVTTEADCGACGNACDTRENCDAGACEPCGGLDEACCFPLRFCEAVLVCVDEGAGFVCRACGEPGERCCGDFGISFCNFGVACLDVGGGQRRCVACGGLDEPCCGGSGFICDPGLTCDANTETCGP